MLKVEPSGLLRTRRGVRGGGVQVEVRGLSSWNGTGRQGGFGEHSCPREDLGRPGSDLLPGARPKFPHSFSL